MCFFLFCPHYTHIHIISMSMSAYSGSPAVAVLQSTLPKCLIGVIGDAGRQLRQQDADNLLDMDRFRDVGSWGGWDLPDDDAGLPPRVEHFAQCMDLGVGATMISADLTGSETENRRDRVVALISNALQDVCSVAARHSDDDFIPDPMYPDEAALLTAFSKQLMTSACTKLTGPHMKCVSAFDEDYEVRDPAWPCVQAVLQECVVHGLAAMANQCREPVGEEEEEEEEDYGSDEEEESDGEHGSDPMVMSTIYEDGEGMAEEEEGEGGGPSGAVGVVPVGDDGASTADDDEAEDEVVPSGAPRSSFRSDE